MDDHIIRLPLSKQPSRRRLPRRAALALLLGLGLALLVAILFADLPTAEAFQAAWETIERLPQQGASGQFLFVVCATLWMLVLLPASFVLLSAGALWGVKAGLLVALATHFSAGICAFALGRGPVFGLLARHPSVKNHVTRLRSVVASEGLTATLLARFSALPLWLVNYGLGAAGAKWSHYLVCSLAVIPNTWVFVATGDAMGSLTAARPERDPLDWILLASSVLATLVLLVLLGRKANQMFAEQAEQAEHGEENASRNNSV